ncbi:hypothetical protein Atai01_18920 [Amycolatopsis taiwanensis]|uniref:Uncharacterized protein n=1 Tax=Amycolatopsis taiwanensis TaxID=342230 RepID=A0A9W6VBR2_9PSEU|nr:hypothetical protein Atai01_18920 [Amycolatopsis taiwanensis]
MSPHAGWSGLVFGTAAAVMIFLLCRVGVFALPGQGTSFLAAAVAFVVSVVVSLVAKPKPDAELVGLVHSLTPEGGPPARDHR